MCVTMHPSNPFNRSKQKQTKRHNDHEDDDGLCDHHRHIRRFVNQENTFKKKREIGIQQG
jgi:hypothetical protein